MVLSCLGEPSQHPPGVLVPDRRYEKETSLRNHSEWSPGGDLTAVAEYHLRGRVSRARNATTATRIRSSSRAPDVALGLGDG